MHSFDALQSELMSALSAATLSLGAPQELAQNLSLSPVPDTSEGDVAFACFCLRGKLQNLEPKEKNNPVAIAAKLAQMLSDSPYLDWVESAGPYVNMQYRTDLLSKAVVGEILEAKDCYGTKAANNERVVVEFSGPNTNKPQHLGHLRNNVIGESVSRILSACGYDVKRVNIINDRGIHICKSILSYQRFANDATPESTHTKGDHFIGDYYVRFEQEFQAEYDAWLASESGAKAYDAWLEGPDAQRAKKQYDAYYQKAENKRKGKAPADLRDSFKANYKDKYFNTESELGRRATELLVKWEEGDPEVRRLSKQLNDWVISGFMQTYDVLGLGFDKIYYESETYKLGKDIVLDGLERKIFHQLPDNAVAYDLSRMKLEGDKILLRANGTTVYMTQDIGTALARFDEFSYDHMIYVVADEQNHHFRVLFGILEDLREDLKDRFEHLSYGMVTLPTGRMKSREGTVVDTDNLIVEIKEMVKALMDEKSDREYYVDADEAELERRAQVIALAAIRYYLLDVTPSSWMEFNPEKSIDLQGRTGAYCLMNYARTRSILRKAKYEADEGFSKDVLASLKSPQERKILLQLAQYKAALQWACDARDPSKLAEYLFNLCKGFAFIFTDRAGHPILTCEDAELREARLRLVDACGSVLRNGLTLLGIECLEVM
ncbi:MAG: arginine--tRNA ligase [Bradymonadales bacterium]